MKAMIINQYGGPEVFEQADTPVPEPTSGEVQVKVQAVSINPVDYKFRKNGPYKDFPVILGWDVAGVVEALGPGVSKFNVGDEVFGMVRFPKEGRAYAEYLAAPVSDIARIPEEMSFTDAAAMCLAALTAHQALEKMGLSSGQTVLIHAGSGGVGHFAVQLAKARGAKVIATASGNNRDFVLGLGADEFINYHEQRFEDAVKDVDAVFDTVGGETLERSYGVVKKGGWLVSIVGEPAQDEAQQHGIYAERISVHTSRADLELLASQVTAGKLKPQLSRTFALEQVADAHRAQETGHTVGKIVLEVG